GSRPCGRSGAAVAVPRSGPSAPGGGNRGARSTSHGGPARGNLGSVRIATWNVNSLKGHLDKVEWWLARARPDALLMQETKLADTEAPGDVFRRAGYALAHHGEGRW